MHIAPMTGCDVVSVGEKCIERMRGGLSQIGFAIYARERESFNLLCIYRD